MIKKHLFLILLFIAIIPTFSFLLRPNIYWNMHDDMQIIRQLEMEKCFNDGQIPCRWTPDLGFGYGYPLFNFYPPLPYLIGQLFRTIGFSFVATIKITAIVQIIASSLAMYLLGSLIFGSFGGLIAGIFYAYAPYRAVNIYVRGAMNEAWASVFFPLIFYFTQKLIMDKKFSWKNSILLSLSVAGLLLSHNPMALTFIPFVALWSLFWLTKQKFDYHKIISLGLSAIGGLGISAYYTLPVLFEAKYVQIESMFENYYHYSVHFVSFNQLFISNFWGDGPSVWGTNDGMSFMIGYVHWIVPILLIIYSIYLFIKKKNNQNSELIILLGAMGFVAALMTHQKSGLIWQYLPLVQKIQFPWRFLSHSSFLLALTCGSLGIFLKKYKLIFIPIFIIIFVLNINHYTPITFGPITDNQKLSGKAWENQITSGIYDYLPKTAKTAPKSAASPIIDNINVSDNNYQVTGLKNGTDWTIFNINLQQDATIILSRLAYPGFAITDFGQNVKYTIEPELGRFQINLSAGNHQIYMKLHNTPIRHVGNIISLITIAFLLWKIKTLKQ